MRTITTIASTLFCLGMLMLAPASSLAEESSSALDSMISPVSNPINFEDPRMNTEIRPFYMYHKLDSDFVTGSGDIQLYAAQVRYAFNDRLAFIATKDGYAEISPDKNLPDSYGAANLAAGLKYAFYKEDVEGQIATVGLRYELASGDPDVFQGNGDGIINPFLSGAMAYEGINFMGYTALRIPVDSEDSGFFDVSLHADYPINDFYPLIEFNMVNVYDAGSRIALEGEGFDVINFGSSKSEGSTVVTAAVGARYRINDWADFGAAYEFVLTDRHDVFDWRVTTDFIFSLPI